MARTKPSPHISTAGVIPAENVLILPSCFDRRCVWRRSKPAGSTTLGHALPCGVAAAPPIGSRFDRAGEVNLVCHRLAPSLSIAYAVGSYDLSAVKPSTEADGLTACGGTFAERAFHSACLLSFALGSREVLFQPGQLCLRVCQSLLEIDFLDQADLMQSLTTLACLPDMFPYPTQTV